MATQDQMATKVLISGLFIHPGKVGGAEHYFYNLLQGFKDIGVADHITLVLNQAYIGQYRALVNDYQCHYLPIKRNRALYELSLETHLPDEIDANVWFLPNYVSPIARPKGVKVVTTIHDLQYLHFPQFFSAKKRLWLRAMHANTMRMANKVVAISDFVKQDIIDRYQVVKPSKLVTIPNAIDFTRFDEQPLTENPYGDFILSVAAHYPHKNILTLIKAFRHLKQTNILPTNYRLMLVGQLASGLTGGAYETYAKEMATALSGHDDIVVTGYLSDLELGKLYQLAKMFVFPSLFEGFGMPVAEAMGMGLVTACGQHTSLPEISLGKAVYLQKLEDHKAMAQDLADALNAMPTLSKAARETQTEIRQRYAPATVASQYWQVFQSA